MRIECTESVVVNNIIGSFIKQQPTIDTFCKYLIREVYTVTLIGLAVKPGKHRTIAQLLLNSEHFALGIHFGVHVAI